MRDFFHEGYMKLEIKRRALVGEGAIWNNKSKKLLWIDIDGKMLYEYDPESKTEEQFELPSEPGTVVPVDERSVVLALADGIYTFDLETGTLTKKASNPDRWRFNDGKCDLSGRLWVGTAETETYSRALSSLFRVDPDYTIVRKLCDVIISNGISWSRDDKHLYYINSPLRKVTCFDFHAARGDITNPRDCLTFPVEMGTPDGNTLDSDGNLWIAFWDGSCIAKCDPRGGKIITKYDVPAHNVTSLAFGGEDLRTLFITTASTDMSEDEKKRYPHAGSVFSFEPGATGVPANFFKPTRA